MELPRGGEKINWEERWRNLNNKFRETMYELLREQGEADKIRKWEESLQNREDIKEKKTTSPLDSLNALIDWINYPRDTSNEGKECLEILKNTISSELMNIRKNTSSWDVQYRINLYLRKLGL